MATTKTIQLLAKKLDLAEEGKILSKAAEFVRLIDIKSNHSLSNTSKIVVSLDLAASLLGTTVDLKTAIKYSGLKGPGYKNCRNIVENILELNNDKITISSLCLNLQCTEVEDLAEKILLEYQKLSKMELDMALPQYIYMAVYQACRVKKVKLLKSKVIEKSRLKPGQWSKMEADWTKCVDGMPLAAATAATAKKRGRTSKIIVSEDTNEMDIDQSPKKENPEPKMESYEDWKHRMLKQAHEELEEMEIENSPKKRISLHETDEILSQSKTPTKSGLRLNYRRI